MHLLESFITKCATARIRPAPIMLKNLPIILLPKFSPIILLCLTYYSQVILRKYTDIRSTNIKMSKEVKSLVLAANCKQGTI